MHTILTFSLPFKRRRFPSRAFGSFGASPVNAVFINSHDHRAWIIELFVEQILMIAVQPAFHCAGAYPIFFSYFLVAYSISAFARDGIIEPSITPLVFCKPNMVEVLRMGFATASAFIAF